jgi:beta-N-acetylhexosaminidase
MLPAILGLSGPEITPDERAFIRDADPAGFILFRRNAHGKAQLRALTDALRELTGRVRLPILVDQEGGRVARLVPPVWPAFPAAARLGALYDKAPISGLQAARLNGLAIALTLAEAGINVAAAPLLDLRHPGGNPVIGDRSFGPNPLEVASLGKAMLDGLAAGGVAGCIKHMPGHGRADADSHQALPVVDACEEALEQDLLPFRRLSAAPFGMTAHILYTAWDRERPATLSPTIVGDVIRGRIGFAGILLSDSLKMAALAGCLEERARGALAAGCDLALHCTGDLAESRRLADSLPALDEGVARRLVEAVPEPAAAAADLGDVLARRDALLALA